MGKKKPRLPEPQPPKKAKRADEDVLADIVILRGLALRLGAERVIDLVRHFK
jgi:hypothetical protein